MTDAVVRVGIAVVEDEGRFLVGVRGPDVPLPGRAEFPGGKCLPGEAPADCAVRECREETGLDVVAERLLLQRTHQYDHATVELHFWRCRPTSPELVAAAHQTFRWTPRADLAALDFPEANAPLIELLLRT